MSLLFNILSRLVIALLPRSKRLLISWLQSLSVVILEPPKIKSATVSTVSPSICNEVMGLDAMIQQLCSTGVAVCGAGATVRRYSTTKSKGEVPARQEEGQSHV